MKDIIKNALKGHRELVDQLLADSGLLTTIKESGTLCINSLRHGGKILFCGNGGSAADAQHLAAELSGRYLIERAPLYAEALHVNTSYLTAVANDYDFQKVYQRAVQAKGHKGDVLIALSTSGRSKNILLALEQARSMDLKTISLTGSKGGEMRNLSDICIRIPSDLTPRIQEMHILIGHTLCDLIEQSLFAR